MKNRLITVYASLDALPSLQARYGSQLSDYRIQKCARLKNAADRDRGMLAEYCLIEALTRAGIPVSLPLRIGTEALQKPFLLDRTVEFSLSHAGDYAAAAVCDLPVGVDIERTRPVTDALAERISTETEVQTVWLPARTGETFRDLFSAKESIVKRSGEGLRALCTVDTTEDKTVRQMHFADYVLSVSTESEAVWEVFRCEKGF